MTEESLIKCKCWMRDNMLIIHRIMKFIFIKTPNNKTNLVLLLQVLFGSPGKNTEEGCHSLPQGNLPHPGIKPRSPVLQLDTLAKSNFKFYQMTGIP